MLTFADTADETMTTEIDTNGTPRHRRSRAALGLLLTATAVFWCIGLSRNGWANAFYAAAVQAGTKPRSTGELSV
ncbi:hypothetical protein H7J51_25495 [Mycobacterium crocinum]|uniref:MFS transporter n=1 Tax=Mycolicibacterium crocinum TaxID=388459 RepID=A0ABY3THB7_9MYCO|nr:hypothetical protein [Mycolicibacterium crocinum]MCV7218618.1 hypothetical protein [Mycolicibacterium crocinum]ULN39234.1 hypothetical protein MI149_15765 [Mycolicibacterium crocinum]